MMTAAVSGSSSGIGLAAAGKFLSEGLRVEGYDIAQSRIDHPNYRHTVHDVRTS